MKLYKVLNENGAAHHGGRGKWALPNGDEPGAWMPLVEGTLIPCDNGYHLCRREDLIHFLGPTIYLAEHRGEMVKTEDKVVVCEARLLKKLDSWNEKTARLFAADCAEMVLHHYEAMYGDDAPRKAIAAARAVALGEIGQEELRAARSASASAAKSAARSAWSAARSARSASASAAESAAWSAASAAGSAASSAAGAARSASARSAWSAAKSAAKSAAESAAWSASASAAVSAAESAAWSAAGSAARSASARSAWSAAESAAWSAAGSAAWSAMTQTLFKYLEP